jgi:PBP1b-binding outer membrane lipoprotein LpoB
MKILALIISLMISSGCAEKPSKLEYVYVPTPLNRPDRPDFPRVKGTDLSCLSNETRLQLLRRDDIMKTYVNKLEATIDATKLVKDQ